MVKCDTMTVDCDGETMFKLRTVTIPGKESRTININIKQIDASVPLSESQVNYLNKPKRASHSNHATKNCNKAVMNINAGMPSYHVQVPQQHTSKYVLKMCDDRSNLSAEMNYKLAACKRSEKCGCAYRREICKKHAVCMKQNLPLSSSLPTVLSSGQFRKNIKFIPTRIQGLKFVTIPRSRSHYIANCSKPRFKNTYGISASQTSIKSLYKCPANPKQKVFRFPHANPSLKIPKVLLNRDVKAAVAKPPQLYSNHLKQTDGKLSQKSVVLGKSSYSVQKWAKKRVRDAVPVQVPKKCRVDVCGTCHCKNVPDPSTSSTLGVYVDECVEHCSKRLLAGRLASLYSANTLNNVSKKSAVVVLPQDLRRSASSWTAQVCDLVRTQAMLHIYRFHVDRSMWDLSYELWHADVKHENGVMFPGMLSDGSRNIITTSHHQLNEDTNGNSETSRKSNRLKKKRDQGVQGRYDADYLVEIPMTKKNKKLKLSGPYGNQQFWKFYKNLLHSNNSWKALCYEYINYMQKKLSLTVCPSIPSTPVGIDMEELLGSRITTIKCSTASIISDHGPNSCQYCGFPFDNLSTPQRLQHTGRHKKDSWRSFIVPDVQGKKYKKKSLLRTTLSTVQDKKGAPSEKSERTSKVDRHQNRKSPSDTHKFSPFIPRYFSSNRFSEKSLLGCLPPKRATARKSRVAYS